MFDSEWHTLAQSCQHCLTQHAILHAQVQTQAQLPVADRIHPDSSVGINEWQSFQALVQTEFLDRVMPVLDQDPQLRSLVPEVVRLMKLLQIDGQFWQAARHPEKQVARQQQFVGHLTQLGQLLSALQIGLESRAGLKKCPD